MDTAPVQTRVAASLPPAPGRPGGPALSPDAVAEEAQLWPASAQRAAVVLILVVLTLLGWHLWQASVWSTRPTRLRADLRIDLARAERAELEMLPGVGPRLAERIEEHRRRVGGFRSLEDLGEVQGIGPVILERLRALASTPEPSGPATGPAAPPSREPRLTLAPGEAIDVNGASAAELDRLPGIGPVLARRIIAARPFQSADDLERVQGIGRKTVERLRPYITVGRLTVRNP